MFNVCITVCIRRPAYGEEHMARVLQMHWIINSDTRCPSVIIKLNYSPSNPLGRKHTQIDTQTLGYGASSMHSSIVCQSENINGIIGTVTWWICLSHAKGIIEVETIDWHMRSSTCGHTSTHAQFLSFVHDRRRLRGGETDLSVHLPT